MRFPADLPISASSSSSSCSLENQEHNGIFMHDMYIYIYYIYNDITFDYMEVSWKGGTPKSSVLMEYSMN